MEIKYTSNYEYYVKAYEKYRKFSVKSRGIRCVIITFLIVFISLYYTYILSDFYIVTIKDYLQPILIWLVINIVFIILFNKLSKKNIKKMINKFIELGSIVLEEKTIEIVDDKLIYKSESRHNKYNMKAFDNIYEEEGLIVKCVQKFTPTVIVPSSAFENEKMKNQFINLIKEKSDYIK